MELVTVRFTAETRIYNPGEQAGFTRAAADRLIAEGVAVEVPREEPAADPVEPSALEASAAEAPRLSLAARLFGRS